MVSIEYGKVKSNNMYRFVGFLLVMVLCIGVLWCDSVWGEGGGAYIVGGTSYGTGLTPICDASYSGIHQPECSALGDYGGGKSWRIYKIDPNKSIAGLNKGASWKIVNKAYGGADIRKIVKQCAADKASHIMILGLNRVVVSGAAKQFYVAFNQTKPGGECGKNRGCYYKWYKYKQIKSISRIENMNFTNGQVVDKDVALAYFKKAKNDYARKEFAGVKFSEVGAFCTWLKDPPDPFILTAIPKEDTGSVLNGGNRIDYDEFYAGEQGLVTSSSYNPTGYTWYKWDDGEVCKGAVGRNCSNSKMPAGDRTVYAYYRRDKFEGKTSVSVAESGKSVSTGFVGTTSVVGPVYLSGCEDGCKVTFQHQMQRVRGTSKTTYNITRKTNAPLASNGEVVASTNFPDAGLQVSCEEVESGEAHDYNADGEEIVDEETGGDEIIIDEEVIDEDEGGDEIIDDEEDEIIIEEEIEDESLCGTENDGSSNPGDGSATTVRTVSYDLKPGDVVCETLTFKPETVPGAGTAYTRICVIADGELSTSINAQVRDRESAAKYGTWQDVVYAKPGHKVEFQTSYVPATQVLAGTSVDKIADPTLRTFASPVILGNYHGWSNGYLVTGPHNPYNVRGVKGNAEVLQTWNLSEYTQCASTTKSVNCPSYTVQGSDVGRTISQTAKTLNNVPNKVKIGIEAGANPLILATIDWNNISKTAKAHVPYNFKNTTTVESVDNNLNAVYAGEEIKFKIGINVGDLWNPETNDAYATKVPNAKWKIGVSYDGGEYQWGNVVSGNLNPGDNPGRNASVMVPDDEAGTQICFRSAVYPKDSISPTRMNSNWSEGEDGLAEGDINSWALSEPKCLRLAKKPSMQVWGGGIFTAQKIDVPVAKKYHLKGFSGEFSSISTNAPYVFGSWGELGLVASGRVSGLASGATLGYLTNSNGTVWPEVLGANPPGNSYDGVDHPGGIHDGPYGYCKLSVLTMANASCHLGYAGEIGTQNAMNGIKNDQNAIRELAKALDVGNPEKVNEIDNIDGETAFYKSGDAGIITIKGGNIPKNKTVLVHANNITIAGDITYQDSEAYDKLIATPKIVIYANQTLKINCGVRRVDAVLMAKNVETCGNSDNINAEINSNQLKVYGAILTEKLIANRTYGAAAGVNSMVPAEIIDFDPTLYLWSGVNRAVDGSEGGEETEKNNGLNVDTVYVRELAPRF